MTQVVTVTSDYETVERSTVSVGHVVDQRMVQQLPLNGRYFLDLGLLARPWEFDLATVKAPVLLWHGERDRNVPVAHGRYLASVLPSCRATFYTEEAHLSLPLNHGRQILGALAS